MTEVFGLNLRTLHGGVLFPFYSLNSLILYLISQISKGEFKNLSLVVPWWYNG